MQNTVDREMFAVKIFFATCAGGENLTHVQTARAIFARLIFTASVGSGKN